MKEKIINSVDFFFFYPSVCSVRWTCCWRSTSCLETEGRPRDASGIWRFHISTTSLSTRWTSQLLHVYKINCFTLRWELLAGGVRRFGVLRTSPPFQAIVMVLESKGEKTFKMVLQLLKSLATSSVITVDQIRRVRCPLVFERCTARVYSLVFRVAFLYMLFPLHRAMKEFTWILPTSTSTSLVLTSFWSSLWKRALIWELSTWSWEIVAPVGKGARHSSSRHSHSWPGIFFLMTLCVLFLPRGRKRFVSEGDGGVVKVESYWGALLMCQISWRKKKIQQCYFFFFNTCIIFKIVG